MKILVDKKIALAEEAFSTIGDVLPMEGGKIDAEAAKNVEVLVTRTTTRVTDQLLRNSRVRYVATATAGTDHIDLDALKQHGIGFTSAPGCNATAVAEYVINALICLAAKKSIPLQHKTLGIIGAGNAGKALLQKAECLGLRCLLNDPPLQESGEEQPFLSLDELTREADIISLHVPLTHTGPHPTYHLINQSVLQKIKPGAILINTSRGGVIRESDLYSCQHRWGGLILDVWEDEPDIDPKIVSLADIATPHIAGYSIEAKTRATETVYNNICTFFNLTPLWKSPLEQNQPFHNLSLETIKQSDIFAELMKKTYDIAEDDARLRLAVVQDSPGENFRVLRNSYQFRTEFSAYRVTTPMPLPDSARKTIECLGFAIQS